MRRVAGRRVGVDEGGSVRLVFKAAHGRVGEGTSEVVCSGGQRQGNKTGQKRVCGTGLGGRERVWAWWS